MMPVFMALVMVPAGIYVVTRDSLPPEDGLVPMSYHSLSVDPGVKEM